MKSINEEHFELVAKRCPSCNSLVMARIQPEIPGEPYYSDYKCSECTWISPTQQNRLHCR